jgi:hypothetical protein
LDNQEKNLLQALWRSAQHTHFFGRLDRDSGQFRNFTPKEEATAAEMAKKLSDGGDEIYFAPAHYATSENRTQNNAIGSHAFYIDVWWSSFFGHINRLLFCRFTLESVG